MSYPALMEKLDTCEPKGGADVPGAERGDGPTVEARGGTEEEVEGGKGELLVKREGEGNREEREGCAAGGLLRIESEGTGGTEVDTEGEPMETALVPVRARGLDRPPVTGRALVVAATVRGGGGLAGGVVSIPLSSIIFVVVHLHC